MRTLYTAVTLHREGANDETSAAAVVVQDDVIAWIGPADAAPVNRAETGSAFDAVVDLQGALLTPAFVDAHVHLTETGQLLHGLDLRDAHSIRQLLDLVEQTSRRSGGRPIFGHGWDEAKLAEKRPPTSRELDRASAGGSVYLGRVDVHSAVVSSALAAASGAAAHDGWTPDGRVERDAHHAVQAALRSGLTFGERERLQRTALRSAAAAGIACLHEMSVPHLATDADLRQLLDLAARSNDLPDVVGYRAELVSNRGEAEAVLSRFGGRLAGLAGDLCVDGSVGSRTAALSNDYADAPGERGHLYLDVDQIRDHVIACTEAGVQAGFHVIGDAAAELAVQGFRQAALQVGHAAIRAGGHRLEHLEMVSPRLLAQVADLHLIASVQPAFDAAWGGLDGMYATRLGTARAQAMNPFADLAAAGIALAFGSDSPVTPFDPWAGVRAACAHHVVEQRLTPDDAFAAHTRGGRRAGGVPTDQAGLLEVGAPATFAAWQQESSSSPRCVLTLCRGNVIYTEVSSSPGRSL